MTPPDGPIKPSLSELLNAASTRLAELEDESVLDFYQSTFGENLPQAIERQRILRAAYLLLYRDLSLAQIAERLGYPNQAALDKAFRTILKIDPQSYRERGRISAPSGNSSFDTLYEARIETLPARRVASVLHLGDSVDGFKAFGRLYLQVALQGFDFRAEQRHTLFHDDPFIVPPAARSAHCCISVDQSVRAQGDLNVFDLPAGPHAVVLHKGPHIELEQAYFWLTRWWMPLAGLEAQGSAFTCSYVAAHFNNKPEDCLTEIAVPLSKLSGSGNE